LKGGNQAQIQPAESVIENSLKQVTPPLLLPKYQFNQSYHYGSKNIRLLYGTKSIRKIGQNSWRYSQSEIPVPPGRKAVGLQLMTDKDLRK
jgi:hypothetical protein